MDLYTLSFDNKSQPSITTSSSLLELPSNFHQASLDLSKALVFLIIPGEFFYFSIYFLLKGRYVIHNTLTLLALMAIWISPIVTPIKSNSARSLFNLIVFVASMKILDLWARRHKLPVYKSKEKPSDWLLSLLLMTELRYESFVPNYVRLPKGLENMSQTREICIHAATLTALHAISWHHPMVLAFEILLSIYVCFSSLHLTIKYKNSPPHFAPLYTADSLAGFWSEVWHNSFTSPCISLAYNPLRKVLLKLGLPDKIARSVGMLGAFSLMAIFHMFCVYPVLNSKAVNRIGLFFFINGVATLAEAVMWGKKRHWAKAVLAWTFEIIIATWVASSLDVPSNTLSILWNEARISRNTGTYGLAK
ncbi:hypothetical protein HI914_01645 [Erysiphe necator]|uniref:Wax synthase domain-containing protein n=1 Tax=Uncinula necator TaxID=52586 RepID=A0A0B1NX18_UNCNE|nr:hypothetical protein HI914_01645 [Erysiphe necator]KHJ30907.1 hypothetical protein EV44_g4908 [Erysiphe necator]